MPVFVESRRKKRSTIERAYPGASILDVTSRGEEPWVRFSPFFPHGGVPMPNSAGVFAQSVEGLWQGLKVFERENPLARHQAGGQKSGASPWTSLRRGHDRAARLPLTAPPPDSSSVGGFTGDMGLEWVRRHAFHHLVEAMDVAFNVLFSRGICQYQAFTNYQHVALTQPMTRMMPQAQTSDFPRKSGDGPFWAVNSRQALVFVGKMCKAEDVDQADNSVVGRLILGSNGRIGARSWDSFLGLGHAFAA